MSYGNKRWSHWKYFTTEKTEFFLFPLVMKVSAVLMEILWETSGTFSFSSNEILYSCFSLVLENCVYFWLFLNTRDIFLFHKGVDTGHEYDFQSIIKLNGQTYVNCKV